jgi:hypothetical protein
LIDFEISQDDLAKASRQMTKARTDNGKDEVDLTCYRETLKFVVTGREFTCPARVESRGMVRFPLAILPKLRKVASTFGDKPARIRIEDGRIRVNSMSISIPGITIRQMSDRPIDIPDDAPARDILALKYLFTKEEVAESDLTARFLAANSQRIKAIDSAADTLNAFGITSVDIESLVNIALKSHADTLRAMLRPVLMSERPN